MSGSIARRYAKALLAVADTDQALEQTAAELAHLAALAGDPTVGAALANPLLSTDARRAVARTLAEQLALRPATRHFVCLLADHRRLDQIAAIADQYGKLLDQRLGRVRATITSAVPLAPEQARAVIAAFERSTGRTVLAEQRVDPELLGGLVVDIAGRVYDGSLRTQLRALAADIAGTGIAGSRSFL